MVNCLRGSYDRRFNRGETLKECFEARTSFGNWSVDRSDYALNMRENEVHLIENPVLRAVAMQELTARKVRKTYESITRPGDFGEAPWHGGLWD